MPSLSDHCTHCNRGDRDRAGAIKHEAWCPMFLRGPDAGGDPHEWPTLLEPLEQLRAAAMSDEEAGDALDEAIAQQHGRHPAA